MSKPNPRTNTVETLFLIFVFVIVFVLPVGWLAATLSACGWKGLFIECRVMECRQ